MKKKRLWLILAIGSLTMALSGCKTLQERAAESKYTTPDGVTLMTEAEIRKALVGNTIAGDSSHYPGNSFIEYYHNDGKVTGLWNGQKRYLGEWALSGKILCYRFPNQKGCSTLALSGNEIQWYALDGSPEDKSTWMKGDPKGLAN